MVTTSKNQSAKDLAAVGSLPSTADEASNAQFRFTAAARELAQLNLHYLSLPSVEGKLLAITGLSFSELSGTARWAVADCLFSLFTIEFHVPQRWVPLLDDSAGTPNPRPKQVPGSSAESAFAAALIFFTWHMVRAHPVAAKVLLNLHGDVAAALRGVSISRVLAAADESVHWLAPRWPKNDHFWPTLMRHACDPASAELRGVKWLGRQLLAAESLAYPVGIGQEARRTNLKHLKRRTLTMSAGPLRSATAATS